MTRPVPRRRPTLHRLGALVVALLISAGGCSQSTGPGETRAGEEVVQFEVAAERAPCTGEGHFQCLQVRETPDAPWQLFYDPIEGFTHEPGFRYVLRVARRSVANPPADGSSVAWRLLRILSRTPSP